MENNFMHEVTFKKVIKSCKKKETEIEKEEREKAIENNMTKEIEKEKEKIGVLKVENEILSMFVRNKSQTIITT